MTKYGEPRPRIGAATSIALVMMLGVQGCGVAQSATEAATFTEAMGHFQQHDLVSTRSTLEQVAEHASDPEDRAEALEFLALLSWRYDQNWDGAEALLSQALELAPDRSEAHAAQARFKREQERWDEAFTSAQRAIDLAEDTNQRISGAGQLSMTVIEQGIASLEGTNPAPNADRIGVVLDIVTDFLDEAPGQTTAARILLQLGILAGKGDLMLRGWEEFMMAVLPDNQLLEAPHRVLIDELPTWESGHTDAASLARVTRAMGESGMLREVEMLALSADPETIGSEDPLAADWIAYARMANEVAELTDDYYRATALGVGDITAWQAELAEVVANFWPTIEWPEARREFQPPPSTESQNALQHRFNSWISIGTTAGYEDLHWGQLVVDRDMTVEQYGRSASLRYQVMDMVSNGFQSWAWDFRSSHGGSARADRIFVFGVPSTQAALPAWLSVSDSATRSQFLEDLARDSIGDWERAETNPIGFLPGLRARAQWRSFSTLEAQLESEGLEGDALRDAFVSRLSANLFESLIVAHEGRHAIDRVEGYNGDVASREFRAKLSEIAFAPDPWIALNPIVSATTGDGTPHGQANERVMQGFVDWMEEHADEIPGLDTDRPLLPQLLLLTDDQLKAAARAMDPWAR